MPPDRVGDLLESVLVLAVAGIVGFLIKEVSSRMGGNEP